MTDLQLDATASGERLGSWQRLDIDQLALSLAGQKLAISLWDSTIGVVDLKDILQ